MKVHIHHPRIFGKKLYSKGVHALPDELKKDWFFQAQVEDGSVVVVDESAPKALKPNQVKPVQKSEKSA